MPLSPKIKRSRTLGLPILTKYKEIKIIILWNFISSLWQMYFHGTSLYCWHNTGYTRFFLFFQYQYVGLYYYNGKLVLFNKYVGSYQAVIGNIITMYHCMINVIYNSDNFQWFLIYSVTISAIIFTNIYHYLHYHYNSAPSPLY